MDKESSDPLRTGEFFLLLRYSFRSLLTTFFSRIMIGIILDISTMETKNILYHMRTCPKHVMLTLPLSTLKRRQSTVKYCLT